MSDLNSAAPAITSDAKPAQAPAVDPMAALAAKMYDKPIDGKPADGKPAEGLTKEQLVGKGTEASPEEHAAMRETIKAELAKFETIDQNNPITAEFAELAPKIGLNADGAKQLVEWDAQRREKEWGQISDNWLAEAEKSPSFREDVTLGNDLLSRFGDEGLMADLSNLRIGNNPNLIRFLGKVGRYMRVARR